MYLLTPAILSATAKRIHFVYPNKFCLCSGRKEPSLNELCRKNLYPAQVVAVPAHGTSDLTSPSDGHKKKITTYLFNMFRNPLTKWVFVFVYLTFELRYLLSEISLLESNSMALSVFILSFGKSSFATVSS